MAERDCTQEGFVYQIGVEPVRVDILISLTRLDFGRAWASRRRSGLDGIHVSFLSREDLIANKRATGRARDLLDAAELEGTRRRRKW